WHHWNAPTMIKRGAVSALLAKDRKSNADTARLAAPCLALADRIEPDRGDGAAHAFRIIATVEVLAGDVVERHRLRRYEVREAYLVRLASDRTGDRIHHQLHRQAHTAARHPAVRQDRRFVRRYRPAATTIFFEAIGTREDARHLSRFEGGRKR